MNGIPPAGADGAVAGIFDGPLAWDRPKSEPTATVAGSGSSCSSASDNA